VLLGERLPLLGPLLSLPIPDTALTVLSESVVVGQPYALIAWLAEPGTAWVLPLDLARIPSTSTASQVAAEHITRLNGLRATDDTAFWIYALDGGYGNLPFWQALPRGDRIAFKDATTWGTPTVAQRLHDAYWGEVELHYWANLLIRPRHTPLWRAAGSGSPGAGHPAAGALVELAWPGAAGGGNLAGRRRALERGTEYSRAQRGVALDAVGGAEPGGDGHLDGVGECGRVDLMVGAGCGGGSALALAAGATGSGSIAIG